LPMVKSTLPVFASAGAEKAADTMAIITPRELSLKCFDLTCFMIAPDS